jgi:hypothetical protein
VYSARSSGRTTFNKTTCARSQKYERGGWFKVKITFYFMETIHEPLHVDMMFCALKDNGYNITFFAGAFIYGGGSKF